MTDLNHVNDERADAHLDEQDAAEDWTPGGDGDFAHAPSYDEWNAIRANTGKAPGTFGEYLADITPAINPIVAMLARRWAGERNGAGELPADWIEAEPPF